MIYSKIKMLKDSLDKLENVLKMTDNEAKEDNTYFIEKRKEIICCNIESLNNEIQNIISCRSASDWSFTEEEIYINDIWNNIIIPMCLYYSIDASRT